ncbi:MAG: circularly permuted type 2 ATP-grasp protein [Rhodospirillaceae bacterium]|nr:circularly permuted type 2 ATP-grasp protein [Rhodospirillaceae bacterium]
MIDARTGKPTLPPGPLETYDQGEFFCEMFGRNGLSHTRRIREHLASMDIATLRRRSKDAERELFNLGITFTVYTDRDAIDRILPFDVIPRVLSKKDWGTIESGVKQRVAALNLFLHDIYHDGKVFKDGIIPEELVRGNKNYRREMEGFSPPQGTYVHICGTDLVRDEKGRFRVLEDNARTPSGVSYVIENRHLMMRAFSDLADHVPIRDVDDYGRRLMRALSAVAPAGVSDPNVVILSPGVFNSAYFEHVFLAREMGGPLVEGRDLLVENDKVYMRTTRGNEQVHVIYRRIDDEFLDPQAFNPNSMLGVPGLFEAYRKGNVTLANAVGTGVADDKAVYAYMPRLIRYYLDEDAIIQNVPTNICREADGLAKTLDNLDQLVTKPVGESGGYGVVIGPRASKRELSQLRAKLKADPDNFISQPLVSLSVSPTLIGRNVEPRHVDLRPFALTGDSTWVLPGGLTRVAMKRGSLIVNSSQGGGSKDTWVLD